MKRVLFAAIVASSTAWAAPRLVQLATALGGAQVTLSFDAGVAPTSTVFVFAGNSCFCDRSMRVADGVSNQFVPLRNTERGIASSTQSWVLSRPAAGTREFTVTSAASQLAVAVLEFEGLALDPVEASTDAVAVVTTTTTTPSIAVQPPGLSLGFAWDQTSFGPDPVWNVRDVDRDAEKLVVFGSAPLGLTMVVAQNPSPRFLTTFTFSRSDGNRSNGLHAVLLSLRAIATSGVSPDAGASPDADVSPDAGSTLDGGANADAGTSEQRFVDEFDGGDGDGGARLGSRGALHYQVGCSAVAWEVPWFVVLAVHAIGSSLRRRRVRFAHPAALARCGTR